jgi:hypothetical protein
MLFNLYTFTKYPIRAKTTKRHDVVTGSTFVFPLPLELQSE